MKIIVVLNNWRYNTTPNKIYEVLDTFVSIGSLDYGIEYFCIENDNGRYVDIPTVVCQRVKEEIEE